MRRRHFLTMLVALAVTPACALRSNAQRPDMASIMGYVFTRRKVKFGRRDMRVPGAPVLLVEANHKVVAKTYTDLDGRYEFRNLPVGHTYYIMSLGPKWPVFTAAPIQYYAGIFHGWPA